jgi:dTDP-4-dehydrorhamnose reductase
MIWILGRGGMLGTELSLFFEKEGIPFIGSDREVDIRNISAIQSFADLQKSRITWIVNCAAFTAVDKAEDDVETCFAINASGAENVAVFANSIGARLIYISTDYVFDGQKTDSSGSGYKEDDMLNPMSAYGLSKRDGEMLTLRENPASYIIRTAWLYGKHGGNFVRTMLKLMNERDSVTVVNDQRGTPTWTFDLAAAITTLIKTVDLGKSVPFGIYHFTNDGDTTWFDFAKEILCQGKELSIVTNECAVKPCSSAEYPVKASRPKYSVLDTNKIKSALNITIPPWNVSLKEFLKNA